VRTRIFEPLRMERSTSKLAATTELAPITVRAAWSHAPTEYLL
jgi:hypothetical protein